MSKIEIVKKGITDFDTDCIVNAANDGLRHGSGVCGAIFAAAGARRLEAACERIGYCPTGDAVITPGFRLKAKYIVHAVGPIYREGSKQEAEQLYSAYTRSLAVAMEHQCHSIAFPLISAGIFGYPKDEAWKIAICACSDFIHDHPDYQMDIYFAVLNDQILKLGKLMQVALDLGFSDAAVIDTREIVFNHSFRQFCEQNLCGSYNHNYACPPYCGSPEEMEAKARKFERALVLKTFYKVEDAMDGAVMKPLKLKHTKKSLALIEQLQKEEPCEYLGIMAGPCDACTKCKMLENKPCPFPEKRFSCVSAYCIDVTKLAETCGMEISWDLQSASFFSLYLF